MKGGLWEQQRGLIRRYIRRETLRHVWQSTDVHVLLHHQSALKIPSHMPCRASTSKQRAKLTSQKRSGETEVALCAVCTQHSVHCNPHYPTRCIALFYRRMGQCTHPIGSAVSNRCQSTPVTTAKQQDMYRSSGERGSGRVSTVLGDGRDWLLAF